MKLKKTEVKELTRTLTGGDLLIAKIDYKVSKAEGDLEYHGPKIDRETWGQVLSFFKWAYDVAKSEAQVRLFVSMKNQKWKAWAFPQKGYAGLSTEEIQDDEFRKQRASLFERDDEWVAWGTVHSHAGASAFQSSVDEADEESQGGLHITVGNFDRSEYSIHCRLYHQKDLFEPDMGEFWDIGDPFANVPKEVMNMLPDMADDKLAKLQMCQPVNVEFPEKWKENYRKPVVVETPSTFTSTGTWTDAELEEWYKSRRNGFNKHPTTVPPFYIRIKDAVEDLEDCMRIYQGNPSDIVEVLDFLDTNLTCDILDICKDSMLTPRELLKGFKEALDDAHIEDQVTGRDSGLSNQ